MKWKRSKKPNSDSKKDSRKDQSNNSSSTTGNKNSTSKELNYKKHFGSMDTSHDSDDDDEEIDVQDGGDDQMNDDSDDGCHTDPSSGSESVRSLSDETLPKPPAIMSNSLMLATTTIDSSILAANISNMRTKPNSPQANLNINLTMPRLAHPPSQMFRVQPQTYHFQQSTSPPSTLSNFPTTKSPPLTLQSVIMKTSPTQTKLQKNIHSNRVLLTGVESDSILKNSLTSISMNALPLTSLSESEQLYRPYVA